MVNLASNNYLGFANHPYLKEKARQYLEKWGAGSGGGAHHRRHLPLPPGAGRSPGPLQGHGDRFGLPVGLHRQSRGPGGPPQGGGPGLLRRAEPRQHHRRPPPHQGHPAGLSPRRRGAPGGAPQGPRHRGPQAYRHRRGLLHGRGHRPPRPHRPPGQEVRGGGLRGRRPRKRGPGGKGRGHGAPLRLPEGPGRGPGGHPFQSLGGDRRVRRRGAGAQGAPHQQGQAPSLLHHPPPGGGGGPPGRPGAHREGAREDRQALGEHPLLQGRAGPAGLRHPGEPDPHHPGPLRRGPPGL